MSQNSQQPRRSDLAASPLPVVTSKDWLRLEKDGCAAGWELAALSMGLTPDAHKVDSLRNHKDLFEELNYRRRLVRKRSTAKKVKQGLQWDARYPPNEKPLNRIYNLNTFVEFLAKQGITGGIAPKLLHLSGNEKTEIAIEEPASKSIRDRLVIGLLSDYIHQQEKPKTSSSLLTGSAGKLNVSQLAEKLFNAKIVEHRIGSKNKRHGISSESIRKAISAGRECFGIPDEYAADEK